MTQLIWLFVRAFEEAIVTPAKVEYDCSSNLTITDTHGNVFVVFMDCGLPDYLDHIITAPAGSRVDFFDEHWSGGIMPFMANNLVCWHKDRLLELAKATPNWNY